MPETNGVYQFGEPQATAVLICPVCGRRGLVLLIIDHPIAATVCPACAVDLIVHSDVPHLLDIREKLLATVIAGLRRITT
jgi:hypothetical protein